MKKKTHSQLKKHVEFHKEKKFLQTNNYLIECNLNNKTGSLSLNTNLVITKKATKRIFSFNLIKTSSLTNTNYIRLFRFIDQISKYILNKKTPGVSIVYVKINNLGFKDIYTFNKFILNSVLVYKRLKSFVFNA